MIFALIKVQWVLPRGVFDMIFALIKVQWVLPRGVFDLLACW